MSSTYTSYDDLPLALTIGQFAAILGIGRNTAYAVVRSGAIKSMRVGNQIRIAKSAVMDFLNGTAA